MKSIKTKLITLIAGLVIIIILSMSIVAIINSTNALQNTSDTMLKGLVDQSSKLVENKVHEQLTMVKLVAGRSEMTDDSLTNEQKLEGLKSFIKENNYIKMGIADLNGDSVGSTGGSGNIADREYFINASKGGLAASDPFFSDLEKRIVVVYAVPIIKNDKVVAVMTATKAGDEISNIAKEVTFGKTGKAFMINSEGVKIAHYQPELVDKMDNDLDNVKKDSTLQGLADLETRMTQGEEGVGRYKYNGEKKVLAFAPIKNTSWSMAVCINESEVLTERAKMFRNILILAVLVFGIANALVYGIANNITRRIKVAIQYLKPIAEGDLSNEISQKHLGLKDEIGDMVRAIYSMQDSIRNMLTLIVHNSEKIDTDAQGLSAVSQEMTASVGIVSDAIQDVAKGSVSQATSISAIADGMNDFSTSVDLIAADVKLVDESAQSIRVLSKDSNDKMVGLADSVNNTNTTFRTFEKSMGHLSDNIDKINVITNVINGISEQTNLLALNAAIEAARAGEAGKGFGVVADEIRKLAEQSRKSSENIASLIAEIVAENETMTTVSNNVSKEFAGQVREIEVAINSFNKIVEAVEEIMPKIVNVNHSTEMIDEKKNDFMMRIEEISAVSQQTSASTEEISASAEQMSSSSEEVSSSASNLSESTGQMIKEVEKFKL